MKNSTSKLLLLLVGMLGSALIQAQEPFYTLTAIKGSCSGYANTADVTCPSADGMTWNVPGNQNLDGGIWRIGGKSLTNVNRTITGKSPMASAIGSVVLNHNGISRASVTVNSITLTVASDADYSTVIGEVTVTSPAVSSAGSVTFEPADGKGWATGAYYKFDINVTNTTTSNGGLDLTSIAFYPYEDAGGVTVSKPVISPDGGTYDASQQVVITADPGCVISYTTDGTAPTGSTATVSADNTVRLTISRTGTVRAVAIDADGNVSREASATYTILTPITSISALWDEATTAKTPALVRFTDWICTGVKGSNAYFTDGTAGALLYESGHGFQVGDVLNGSATVTLTLYNDMAEIMGLKATTETVTVTKGNGATPKEVSVADLQLRHNGNLITLRNVTYDAANNVFVDDDDNSIIPYGNFITLPALADGKQYDVTGVAIWYKSKSSWEIAPRSADEIVLLTNLIAPTSAWSTAEETVSLNGTVAATFTTNSDGAVSYSSSDETVATIDAKGTITAVGKGTTVITAAVAETDTYLADRKSFTLHVIREGYYDVAYTAVEEDMQGQGAPNAQGIGFGPVVRGDISLVTTNAYVKEGNKYMQIYGTNSKTGNSNIELTAADGYAITAVVLSTEKDYTRTWKDQLDNDVETDGTTVVWEGFQKKVVLTNRSTSQARVSQIAVSYVRLTDTGKTVTIGESGVATYSSDVAVMACGETASATVAVVIGVVSLEAEPDVAYYDEALAGSYLAVRSLSAVVPAQAGVLLMGDPGVYKVYSHEDMKTADASENLLVAAAADTQAPAGSYVLGQDGGTAAFFRTTGATPVAAGQAYLALPGDYGQPVYYLSAKDLATAIVAAPATTPQTGLYDLSGRKVSKAQKGIYIVNGKKVVM